MNDIEKLLQALIEQHEKMNSALVLKISGTRNIGMSETGMKPMKRMLRARKRTSFREGDGV